MSDKVGVVFVKTNFLAGRQLLISASRALGENAFAGLFLRDNLPEGRAFWRGIFRMRMVVVKTGTVRKNEVAFYFLEAKRAVFVDLVVSRFVGVLK